MTPAAAAAGAGEVDLERAGGIGGHLRRQRIRGHAALGPAHRIVEQGPLARPRRRPRVADAGRPGNRPAGSESATRPAPDPGLPAAGRLEVGAGAGLERGDDVAAETGQLRPASERTIELSWPK